MEIFSTIRIDNRQKFADYLIFANYNMSLVITGDFSEYQSTSLKDFY